MTDQEAIKYIEQHGFIADEVKDMCINAIKKQTLKEKADGCKGCAFETVNEWEMPCAKCKRNSKDYWRAKGDVDDYM